MDNLYILKGQIQQIYAEHSKLIDKGIQFVLALAAFYMINHDMGFMALLSNPLITLGLAVICAFLPMIVTVIVAAALILAQMSVVSLPVMGITAAVFIVMFVFYVRFTPKTAIVILLTSLAFLLKVPFVIPVAFGLIGTPLSLVPIICGTIVYYMIDCVKTSASTWKSASMFDQLGLYVKRVFQSKEMILILIAFVIVLLLVHQIRRMPVNHAWKSASAAGAVAGIVIVAAGSAALDVKISYPELLLGNIAAVIVGLVLELLFFAVDYSRCENVQYEDDEYYYYVKAVPKILVSAPEKTVKRINRRSEQSETEIIDADEIRRKSAEAAAESNGAKEPVKRQKKNRTLKKGRSPQTKESSFSASTDELLLTRSLRKDLHLDDEEKKE